MSYVIKRQDNGLPTYFSPATGRKFGQPTGGWVGDLNDAIQFGREKDAKEFVDCFMNNQRANVSVTRV